MSKKLKVILVTNSVPLPATDFLKYKLFGLSKVFDLHLLCWDTDDNRQAFYQKYTDKLERKNIHLFYNKWNFVTAIRLLLISFLRFLLYPHICIPLKMKLLKKHGWNAKKVFVDFCLYFPIVKLKPDVLHFEYGTLAHRFSNIKQFVDCKISVSFRGYDINYVGLEDKSYYDNVWQSFDGFHFLGRDLKQRAHKRGYNSNGIEAIIPPAIDTDFFKTSNVTKSQDKLIVISVGRLAWKKGYEYGLQAIAKLRKKNIPVEYKIIADGDYRQPILFAISELGLEDSVQIISEQEHADVKLQLETAHVFLHPAISEGFSNAVLEAQAMGLPVITTSADGLAENVEDGVTGFVVPVYDASAMADKLEWCYKNMDKLDEIGRSGIQRVNTHFRIDEQVKKFEAFYKEVNEL